MHGKWTAQCLTKRRVQTAWRMPSSARPAASISPASHCSNPAAHRLAEDVAQGTPASTARHRHGQSGENSGSKARFRSRETQGPVPAEPGTAEHHESSGVSCVKSHLILNMFWGIIKHLAWGWRRAGTQTEVGIFITGQSKIYSRTALSEDFPG